MEQIKKMSEAKWMMVGFMVIGLLCFCMAVAAFFSGRLFVDRMTNIVKVRALDWKNAPERRRLARILAAARERIEGGYLRWLAPRARHQRHNVDRKT